MLSCALSGHCRKGVLNGGVVTGSDGLKEGFGFSICHCQEVGIVLCFSPLLCHRDFSPCLWRWYVSSQDAALQAVSLRLNFPGSRYSLSL